MGREKARIAIYALAGVYLLYLAYQMFKALSTAGSERLILLIFAVLFALIGTAAVALGIYSGCKKK